MVKSRSDIILLKNNLPTTKQKVQLEPKNLIDNPLVDSYESSNEQGTKNTAYN